MPGSHNEVSQEWLEDLGSRVAERVWRGAYEQLRAVVLAGGNPEDHNARRLAR